MDAGALSTQHQHQRRRYAVRLNAFVNMEDTMSNVGRIYVESELGGDVYVLLKTKLGYIALKMSDGSTFGGIQRTVAEATNGLTATGYRLDIDRTSVSGRPFQDH